MLEHKHVANFLGMPQILKDKLSPHHLTAFALLRSTVLTTKKDVRDELVTLL